MPPLQNYKKHSEEEATRIKVIEKVNRQSMVYVRMYLRLTFEIEVLTEFLLYGKQKFHYGLVSVSSEKEKRNLNNKKLQERLLYSVILSHRLS